MLTIFEHEDCLDHITPPGHPERVDRLHALRPVIDASGADIKHCPLAEDKSILLAHDTAYFQSILDAAPTNGSVSLDADTHMSPGSLLAARRGAGGNIAATDLVMSGAAKAAFVACRPPGHHAERARPMGFCLFANASIAAHHAMKTHGIERVAIADFDVHHGNGTQDVFWDDPRVLFASSQQHPLWPGTGMELETGVGNIYNATLAPGAGGAAFRKAWEDRLLPAIAAHEPELIIISAGFDAHRRDPLAELMLDDDDFAWITRRLCDLAADHADGRVVSTLEGGYDLTALASAGAAHLKALKEHAA